MERAFDIFFAGNQPLSARLARPRDDRTADADEMCQVRLSIGLMYEYTT